MLKGVNFKEEQFEKRVEWNPFHVSLSIISVIVFIGGILIGKTSSIAFSLFLSLLLLTLNLGYDFFHRKVTYVRIK